MAVIVILLVACGLLLCIVVQRTFANYNCYDVSLMSGLGLRDTDI